MNDSLLKALSCQPQDRPPIWIMRQAGRYLPEYRQLREKFSFQTLIHTPSLAVEITTLPIRLLHFDAAILFSDILVICEVFGWSIHFKEGKGIWLKAPHIPIEYSVKETLHYVFETITLLKQTLQVPLIGFCGGPYTICRYMHNINHEWLEKITAATIEYLELQIKAGVDAIQIFDSWAGLLPPEEFQTLALPYLKRLVSAVQSKGVKVIVFCRGSSRFIPELISLSPSAIGFDWEKDLSQIILDIPSSIAIQGNLNPTLLKAPRADLKRQVDRILSEVKGRPGYIFNLGHGIEPDTPVENVKWLVDYIQGI
ncbi:uroporphyrinogen decarboxylase [Rhabdochlamydiaceae symbiont of Dictyostelium giganteum]|uniref:uroporphyrinogen decarboxylase n=1 Tax=Rhabdochlamydiaceae symbiont of Dictyostelium giganteum TaxID=3342349 RepID=UPI00384B9C7B